LVAQAASEAAAAAISVSRRAARALNEAFVTRVSLSAPRRFKPALA
jgi:hypothetical protein